MAERPGDGAAGAPAPRPRPCAVDAALRAEFPQLALVAIALPVGRLGRSPAGVRRRLDALADRFRGAEALVLRQRPVPHAYRVFFRHVGLDPDATPVPLEAAAVQRLVQGGWPSRGLLHDARTIALVETGVPVWALDAQRLVGDLRLRLSADGDRLGRDAAAAPLPPGRIVVADDAGPVAVLFDEVAPGHAVTRRTRALVLYAIAVPGVEAIRADEALATCADVLRGG